MIKCPYCGKDIEVQALQSSAVPAQATTKTKWYFSTYWVVIAFLCIGPFALPFVWFNPRYKPVVKLIVTVLVIFATIWLTMKSIDTYRSLMEQMKGLNLGY
jgi:hypothetical protein